MLKQEVIKDYKPIEPQSYFPIKLKNLAKKIAPPLVGFIAFTWFVLGMQGNCLKKGTSLEKELLRGKESTISKIIDYSLLTLSKPGIIINSYLYEKKGNFP